VIVILQKFKSLSFPWHYHYADVISGRAQATLSCYGFVISIESYRFSISFFLKAELHGQPRI